MIDPVIDKSPEQKRMRVERLRIELFDLGFSVVKTGWLHNETQNTKPETQNVRSEPRPRAEIRQSQITRSH